MRKIDEYRVIEHKRQKGEWGGVEEKTDNVKKVTLEMHKGVKEAKTAKLKNIRERRVKLNN